MCIYWCILNSCSILQPQYGCFFRGLGVVWHRGPWRLWLLVARARHTGTGAYSLTLIFYIDSLPIYRVFVVWVYYVRSIYIIKQPDRQEEADIQVQHITHDITHFINKISFSINLLFDAFLVSSQYTVDSRAVNHVRAHGTHGIHKSDLFVSIHHALAAPHPLPPIKSLEVVPHGCMSRLMAV